MIYRRIEFTKEFTKQFKKLLPTQREHFYDRLRLFEKNPQDRVLRDHALQGRYKGFRSIDIEGDLRALYYVKENVIVVFAIIGTHSQLY